jgi:hypothetical protein
MNINIQHLETGTKESDTALFCQYSGQTNPQECYIELNCDTGSVCASSNPEIGNAVPFGVWHRRTLRFSIPCLLAANANSLMDGLEADLQIILDGYKSHWDGSNWIGEYSDTAQEAIDRIEYELENDDFEGCCVSVQDAADWFQDASPDVDVAILTDHDISVLGETIDAQAWDQEKLILRGTLEYLESLRENAAEEL